MFTDWHEALEAESLPLHPTSTEPARRRPSRPLDQWIQHRLRDVHPEIREETQIWINVLRNGGPRRRPRSPSTVRTQVTYATPFLLTWSQRYRSLRQVTQADLAEWLATCPAPYEAAVALRGLFKILKAQRVLFSNPARDIAIGEKPRSIPKSLPPEAIKAVGAAADTNAALKLLVALIGIHALYPRQARMLPLEAIDFRRRRLVVDGIDRPLDDFTRQAAANYLRLRHARWPHTRNPYLFVSSQTAYTDASVTIGWMQPLLRDLPAPARQLREDRLLEEAAASGGDPLHLCALSNVGPQTGLRYVRPLWPAPGTTPTESGSS